MHRKQTRSRNSTEVRVPMQEGTERWSPACVTILFAAECPRLGPSPLGVSGHLWRSAGCKKLWQNPGCASRAGSSRDYCVGCIDRVPVAKTLVMVRKASTNGKARQQKRTRARVRGHCAQPALRSCLNSGPTPRRRHFDESAADPCVEARQILSHTLFRYLRFLGRLPFPS